MPDPNKIHKLVNGMSRQFSPLAFNEITDEIGLVKTTPTQIVRGSNCENEAGTKDFPNIEDILHTVVPAICPVWSIQKVRQAIRWHRFHLWSEFYRRQTG